MNYSDNLQTDPFFSCKIQGENGRLFPEAAENKRFRTKRFYENGRPFQHLVKIEGNLSGYINQFLTNMVYKLVTLGICFKGYRFNYCFLHFSQIYFIKIYLLTTHTYQHLNNLTQF
ncbi:Hypothetical_protein [Hexamita inflata]|uniref:Hypothetical_protein n=1 Tax=Hexamita inflata TaxID=28002 RepID=A0AA86TW45_9EUKA|nr:Hypothetical protein HINF_LOCUS16982 [Hexamita inflata]